MSSISQKDFDFYIKNQLNVLLIGDHGVGKTHIVLDAFKRNGLKYRYFSCSTMDPWIDFIGVPRETKNEKTGQSHLELVRPKDFCNDEVEAIFLDEYNRAHKKVRNAVMELIQFKSINGHVFKNLKVVWAAINPDDGNYDTEGMDAAQKDRFHIQIEVPFVPDRKYFANKYGAETSEAACSWWAGLPPEIKKMVSPRRLDYALHILNLGGDIRGTVLPEKSGVAKLIQSLKDGPSERKFKELMDKKDADEMRKFLANENNYADCQKMITSSDLYTSFCLPLLSIEKQMSLMPTPRVEKIVFANSSKYYKLIESIAENSLNNTLKEKAKKLVTTKNETAKENPFADQYQKKINVDSIVNKVQQELK